MTLAELNVMSEQQFNQRQDRAWKLIQSLRKTRQARIYISKNLQAVNDSMDNHGLTPLEYVTLKILLSQ